MRARKGEADSAVAQYIDAELFFSQQGGDTILEPDPQVGPSEVGRPGHAGGARGVGQTLQPQPGLKVVAGGETWRER